MKARKLVAELPGGKKIPMSALVPLDTPLLVQIFPIYACNFKCKYCTFSISKKDRSFISNKVIMDLDLFKKCVDDSKKFPNKIKVLRFVGMGEPLLHKDLSKMIRYAADSNMFERIEIITNASLLTHEISNELIASGLTKLLISIQGTSAAKYLEISDVKIDFDIFVNNIKYFYDNKQNIDIHIKIADCALDNIDDENRFFKIFGDICDTIAIEYIGPIHTEVEYNSNIAELPVNQYGENIVDVDICSQPFYLMQINPDGNIVPCHSLTYPKILGNCYNQSIFDIWNSKIYHQFCYNMLNGIHNMQYPCNNCGIFKHRASNSDDLSCKKEQLKLFYGNRI